MSVIMFPTSAANMHGHMAKTPLVTRRESPTFSVIPGTAFQWESQYSSMHMIHLFAHRTPQFISMFDHGGVRIRVAFLVTKNKMMQLY
jgi:hypothetical protein